MEFSSPLFGTWGAECFLGIGPWTPQRHFLKKSHNNIFFFQLITTPPVHLFSRNICIPDSEFLKKVSYRHFIHSKIIDMKKYPFLFFTLSLVFVFFYFNSIFLFLYPSTCHLSPIVILNHQLPTPALVQSVVQSLSC